MIHTEENGGADRSILILKQYLLILLLSAISAHAQGSRSDYERALGMGELVADKVFKQKVNAHWFSDNSRFWYRNDLPGDAREFILVDAQKGTRAHAFDHKRLADALSGLMGTSILADKLPVERLEFGEDSSSVLLIGTDSCWRCDLDTYKVEAHSGEAGLAGSLDPVWRLAPSRSGGEETFITFVNRSQAPVEVCWITMEMGKRPYATLAPGQRHRQHTFAGHAWLVTDAAGGKAAVFVATDSPGEAVINDDTLREGVGHKNQEAEPQVPRYPSPDKKWTAFIRDFNVVLLDEKQGVEQRLTTDGNAEDRYRGEVLWSPDSRHLAIMRVKPAQEHKVHIVESSPNDQLQPRLHTFDYLKPGDRIAHPRPCLFEVAGMRKIPVDDAQFSNPWSIHTLRWTPDSKRFTFVYNERGHQSLRVLAVDAETGIVEAIVDETSDTFIHYSGKYFLHWMKDCGELIWMSERDGWNHLYLYDAITGQVKNRITRGDWVVRTVEHVDEAARRIRFWAGGVRAGQDPYYRHLCRVDFDGSGFIVLTEGDGTHGVKFSPDRAYFIDRWSRVDAPPVSELRSSVDGRLICRLEEADDSLLLKTGWQRPERFVAKGRDGKTDIHGIIIRPTDFDATRTYPVIEEIYAGPHSAFVPKAFGLQVREHAMAELGFIVVRIDGMGTSHRSKAFHDVCWKNLGDSGFPDRIIWMKAAAAEYPYMDLSRVGIYGGSAGGQSALRALITHGDFYKAAVADCGCHDNRMDKIWWNEQWMGWPIGPHYEEQSNVTQAHRLQGKLMLTVGELDRNVDPASTMQVVNALVKADKDFDLIILPGQGHGAGERPYAYRRRMDFFVRHLLNVEPRNR